MVMDMSPRMREISISDEIQHILNLFPLIYSDALNHGNWKKMTYFSLKKKKKKRLSHRNNDVVETKISIWMVM